MAHQHARSRFPRTGVRRATDWQSGPRGSTGAIAVAGVTVFPIALTAVGAGLTIIRIRGELMITMIGSTVLDGFERVGFGMCIVSENAIGVGVTAVPAPIADIAWDGWLWYHLSSPQELDADATVATGNRVVIDSKAMRKWKQTDVLIAVVETVSEVGTASLEATLNTRTLLKLP